MDEQQGSGQPDSTGTPGGELRRDRRRLREQARLEAEARQAADSSTGEPAAAATGENTASPDATFDPNSSAPETSGFSAFEALGFEMPPRTSPVVEEPTPLVPPQATGVSPPHYGSTPAEPSPASPPPLDEPPHPPVPPVTHAFATSELLASGIFDPSEPPVPSPFAAGDPARSDSPAPADEAPSAPGVAFTIPGSRAAAEAAANSAASAPPVWDVTTPPVSIPSASTPDASAPVQQGWQPPTLTPWTPDRPPAEPVAPTPPTPDAPAPDAPAAGLGDSEPAVPSTSLFAAPASEGVFPATGGPEPDSATSVHTQAFSEFGGFSDATPAPPGGAPSAQDGGHPVLGPLVPRAPESPRELAALDGVALTLAFFVPPLGFVLGLVASARGRAYRGWSSGIARAAVWVSVGMTVVFVIGGAFLWFQHQEQLEEQRAAEETSAERAAIVEASAPFCGALSATPQVFEAGDPDYGWPTLDDPAGYAAATAEYAALWQSLVPIAPPSIAEQVTTLSARVDQIAASANSLPTPNRAGDLLDLRAELDLETVETFVAEYCSPATAGE